MSTLATVLGRAALVLTALFAVGGLLFALGYAWDDPGGWTALLLTLATAVPLIGLTWLAYRSHELATKILIGLVVLFAAYAVTTTVFLEVRGLPVIPNIALIVALPVAVVGQRHALRAGLLLLALAAVPLLEVIVRMVRETDGAPFGALLGGSTGVVIVPLAVLGALFLVAAALGGQQAEAGRHRIQQPPRPATQH